MRVKNKKYNQASDWFKRHDPFNQTFPQNLARDQVERSILVWSDWNIGASVEGGLIWQRKKRPINSSLPDMLFLAIASPG